MADSSKNRFTLKIVISYLVLAILALVVGFFMFSEIKAYLSNETADANDSKLLKTSALLTQLYEAESLSRIAIQTKTKTNFIAYSNKIDSISIEIDSLKLLTESGYQKGLLDSVQILLEQKVANSNQLRILRVQNEANNSLDKALKEFKEMEASLGKITPEALAPNIEELSPKAQSVIRDLATYLNNNVPKDRNDIPDSKKIDSILTASKALINQAKIRDTKTQRSLARKEFEIHNNDLVLSHQLRSIIAAFEQEVILNTYNDNFKKQAIFRRSMRLAGIAALLGFVIVGIFTFLLNRDFWKVQGYRLKLEKEKKFSESVLKSREQLISTVSHDLRTPLNTITGYSELLENTTLTDKQSSYIRNVKSASLYVDSLVNDLLDFSKLEAGKIKIDKMPFVFSDLLRETAENLREINKDKLLDLILNIDERLDVPVVGDPFRIRQIVSNLIGNAYKFTSDGYIQIDAEIKKESSGNYLVVLAVADSGIGIKKEKQELIFKEFTQADEETEKRYGGYGLGLTISKKLTELLDGTITLKSEEGKGSTFILNLPLKTISTTKINGEQHNIIKNNDRLSILIIDDDTSMLQLLSEVCSTLGISTYTYSSFSKIKVSEKLKYDLVLTDIQMPDIDGFTVLRKLQSSNYLHYQEQPIIAMTGRRDLDTSIYLKKGFSELLLKPFGKKELLSVLNQLLPNHFYSKNEEKEAKLVNNDAKLYNLSIISSFLGKNEEAINEILRTFIFETSVNLEQFEIAIEHSDYNALNGISHKMLPMFRQLEVQTVVPDLELFETIKAGQESSDKISEHFRQVKKHISLLIEELNLRLPKSPSCID